MSECDAAMGTKRYNLAAAERACSDEWDGLTFACLAREGWPQANALLRRVAEIMRRYRDGEYPWYADEYTGEMWALHEIESIADEVETE